jgi:hypothetical protein
VSLVLAERLVQLLVRVLGHVALVGTEFVLEELVEARAELVVVQAA